MKNIFKTLVAVALIAMTAACSKDGGVAPVSEKATVSFDVQLPGGIVGRATNDGNTATKLFYGVYNADRSVLFFKGETEIHGTTTVKLDLVANQTYDLVFWAQAENAPYAINWDAKTIAMDYTNNKVGSNEKRDAFIGEVNNLTINGAKNETVTLKRPFAQLNIGLSKEQIAKAQKAGFNLQTVAVTAQTHTAFSFAEGVGVPTGNLETVTFAAADYNAPKNEQNKSEITVNGTAYDWVSFNYLLANTPSELTDVTVVFNGEGNKTIALPTFTNVPVERNHRTNIVGDLLTDPANFNVTIDATFDEEPGHVVEAWDGVTVEAPAYIAEEETYVIEEPSQLAWLAGVVNGTISRASNDFAGETFVLTGDINLGGHPWTPIGTSSNPFKGTFDGQNHTISNLVVTMPGKSDVGLFGVTHDGEIKNVTVENATIEGRLNVAVVAGQPYTSKYTNITVKGHVEVNGMAYVGGVGGKNAYADWTNITVEVDNTSYVNGNSVENGKEYRTYVGGVIGFMGEGEHTVSNVTSNINVIGSTIDVGGIVGIAHYGNKFEKVSCTGNVTNTSKEAENAAEMGGIAGVWHNETGYTVTMTGCQFTGELSNNAGFDAYYYNGLVGAPYNTSGKGKLVLNSQTYVAVMSQEDLAAAVAVANATVNVPAGEYTFPKGVAEGVTIVCANGVKFTGTSKLDINGATVIGATFSNPNGTAADQTVNGTFKQCKFEGSNALRWCYAGATCVFEECAFDGAVYGVHFDAGANEATFTRCSFSGFNAFGGEVAQLNLNACKFEATGKSSYNGVNLWGKTTATDCEFVFKGTTTYEWIGLRASTDEAKPLVFNNCKVTLANGSEGSLFTYFDDWAEGSKVTVDGAVYTYGTYGVTDENGVVLATNAQALQKATNGGQNVLFVSDILVAKADAASNAYGATGINHHGGVIDGNGKTFGAAVGGTWDSAISTTGGTIQNLTVNKGFRGIFVNHNSNHSEKVVLNNVTINGPTYTISCDQATNQGLEANNCTINGWTSYAATIGEVVFNNCSFGKGAGYKFCRPYAATTFKGCNFCEGFEIDARAAVSFENCRINGVQVTSENIATLVTGNVQNVVEVK